jgi:F-box-like
MRRTAGRVLTIDVLPDDVLLSIFDFYVVGYQDLDFTDLVFFHHYYKIESWQSLVHVCRRWRGLVFGSPRHLNLQLCCTTETPARETLDVWPALPLIICGVVSKRLWGNVIAELEHSDRICQISLYWHTSQIEKLLTAMQVPFPELAILYLSFESLYEPPVLPDSFLGGSAPRLRFLALNAIPFPGLPKLLLSATHLVELRLFNIPHSGYISPEAMVTCLSILTCLETLQLEFISSPDSESQRLPRPTRSVLPSLGFFLFHGVKTYLEELVARIDAPRLYRFLTQFVNNIGFNTPELSQFISRTPSLGAYDEARLIFGTLRATVRLQSHPEPSEPSEPSDRRQVEVEILCRGSYPQLSSLAQICTTFSLLLLTMENLYIYEDPFSLPNWEGDIEENAKWLDLLLPFTTVKNIYLS